jgi:hypothetical protein
MSDQGSISAIISELFNINHDIWGTAISSLAKINMNIVVEEMNDKYVELWPEPYNKVRIENTPLSPYIHQEHLETENLHLQ